jgi:hypothetical protein
MLMDPSLVNGPVTEFDWARPLTTAQGHFPFRCRTAFRERPVFPDGMLAAGSYTPGGDPPDLDAAALATMSKYKLLEPPALSMGP